MLQQIKVPSSKLIVPWNWQPTIGTLLYIYSPALPLDDMVLTWQMISPWYCIPPFTPLPPSVVPMVSLSGSFNQQSWVIFPPRTPLDNLRSIWVEKKNVSVRWQDGKKNDEGGVEMVISYHTPSYQNPGGSVQQYHQQVNMTAVSVSHC